jgi:hypothetical protein
MTVAISILLAMVVGGVVFVLLDNWQRRETPEPVAAAPTPRPEPYVWQQPQPVVAPPEPRQAPPAAPSPLWSGWAERERRD